MPEDLIETLSEAAVCIENAYGRNNPVANRARVLMAAIEVGEVQISGRVEAWAPTPKNAS